MTVGHLWQGRFRSKIISKDKYLVDCINYIELNPVRANLVDNAINYRWSSYRSRILEEKDLALDILLHI